MISLTQTICKFYKGHGSGENKKILYNIQRSALKHFCQAQLQLQLQLQVGSLDSFIYDLSNHSTPASQPPEKVKKDQDRDQNRSNQITSDQFRSNQIKFR